MDDDKKTQTPDEEKNYGLPDNWVPIDAPPLVPSLVVPTADGSSKYLQGSLPPGFQHDVSFTGTAYRQDRTPQLSLMPLGVQGNPASNAAIQSTSTQVTEQVIAATPPSTGGGGGLASVGLAMPKEFVVTNSPVTEANQPGPLTAAWAPELPSTFLGAPAAGLSSFEGAAMASGFAAGGGGTTLLITDTPTTATSLGFIVAGSNSTLSTPAGWSAVPGSGIHSAAWYKSIAGTSPVTVSESLTGTDVSWIASFSLFSGPAPAFVQANNATTKSGTVAFSSNNTAGNTLIVIMQYLSAAANTNYSPIFGDSQNNQYTRIASVNTPFVGGTSTSQVSQQVFVAPNCVGGANTITYNFSGKTLGIPNFTVFIIEFGPLAAGSGIPIFRILSGTDIPPINLAIGGNGGVGGILGVINGGTGSDLSAAGGTSQFLTQSTSGGAIIPVQPDFSDLAGAAGKLATHYNGVVLVSNGLPSEIIKSDLTAQAAAITATTLVSASQTGMYRISWSAAITTADGVSSTLGGTNGFQVIYTSPTDSVVKTTVPQAPWSTGGNTTGTADDGVAVVYAKTGTNIQYTYGYTSATPGQMIYELHIKLEAL